MPMGIGTSVPQESPSGTRVSRPVEQAGQPWKLQPPETWCAGNFAQILAGHAICSTQHVGISMHAIGQSLGIYTPYTYAGAG